MFQYKGIEIPDSEIRDLVKQLRDYAFNQDLPKEPVDTAKEVFYDLNGGNKITVQSCFDKLQIDSIYATMFLDVRQEVGLFQILKERNKERTRSVQH